MDLRLQGSGSVLLSCHAAACTGGNLSTSDLPSVRDGSVMTSHLPLSVDERSCTEILSHHQLIGRLGAGCAERMIVHASRSVRQNGDSAEGSQA